MFNTGRAHNLIGLVVAVIMVIFSHSANAAYNPRYASVVIDADTGVILHERYADKTLHPASLTKMMTLYLTFDALESGRLSLNSRIPISRHAASMVPSKLGLSPGSTIRVEDAILALATKSANDIAVALAEALGKTESRFAILMTHKAQQLGMSRTIFKNASGLHDKRQVSTAKDMARLGQALIHDHKRYYHYFNRKSFSYKGKTYRSHNRLLSSYKGMDGLKTGYVRASGFNLVASAVRGDRRLIGVVFGGRSTSTRNQHMASLLDRGFAKATDYRIAQLKKEQFPLPASKPGQGVLVAGTRPTTTTTADPFDQIDFAALGLLVGEGDIDAEASRDLALSLAKMAKTNGGKYVLDALSPAAGSDKPRSPGVHPPPTPAVKLLQLKRNGPFSAVGEGWSVQVGAFNTQSQTKRAITQTAQKFPHLLGESQARIVPLKTRKGTVYRARFAGLDKKTASELCNIMRDCLQIAPAAF